MSPSTRRTIVYRFAETHTVQQDANTGGLHAPRWYSCEAPTLDAAIRQLEEHCQASEAGRRDAASAAFAGANGHPVTFAPTIRLADGRTYAYDCTPRG